jgi:hypothetical protein
LNDRDAFRQDRPIVELYRRDVAQWIDGPVVAPFVHRLRVFVDPCQFKNKVGLAEHDMNNPRARTRRIEELHRIHFRRKAMGVSTGIGQYPIRSAIRYLSE